MVLANRGPQQLMRRISPLSLASIALIALGLGASATSLSNDYAQDDRPIIEQNQAIHSLTTPWRFFTESYWPEPYDPALYRPLASLGYALQWTAGRGSPEVFRIVSVTLLILTGLAVFRLGRRFLPVPIAWLSAALFLVHPVHVEAVAAGVNQSELIVGLLGTLLVAVYLGHRDQTGDARWYLPRLFAMYLTALLFKESAAVLLGMVIAAELILVRDSAPLKDRLTRMRPTVLGLLLGVAVFIAVRTGALGGRLLGTFVAEAFEGLSVGQRALTMLGVVPHWFRLLLWPAHLRADYSPREIDPALAWGAAQTLGAILLVAVPVVIWYCWRRAPVVAFGLAWTAIALFPVSNVLVPTGVVLAERTLFLPSIGVVLAVGGGLAVLWDSLRATRATRAAILAAGTAGLALGAARSVSRYAVWQSNDTYWRQAVIDSPRSYRAAHAYAQILFAAGNRAGGEREFRRAVALYPKAWGIYFAHANQLKRAGMCSDAVIFYDRTLIVEPGALAARTGMIACLLHDARYREAAAAAREGARIADRPGFVRLFGRFGAVADSASAAAAPVGSVRINIRAIDTLP